uniref:UPF3 domain-containing protein n=1 Tax=Sus scrofa TaxID=9823 RepID=A0A8D1V877_PIG
RYLFCVGRKQSLFNLCSRWGCIGSGLVQGSRRGWESRAGQLGGSGEWTRWTLQAGGGRCPRRWLSGGSLPASPGSSWKSSSSPCPHTITLSSLLLISGLEYPAVVEFAPFQKIAKKKLKKKDTKTGSIEDDPEYKKFLETYCVEEEKASANPETLLGDVEAKTRELIARRTTPLLEYIKNRKLEKQRIREEKREERRRRELEKKRLREEEKRRRREEERCKKKASEKQKKTAEKEVRVKLLKKPEKGEEPGAENPKERGEEIDFGGGSREPGPSCAGVTPRPSESSLEELPEPSQNDSDKEQRDMERRCQEKELEAERHYLDENRRHRAHSGLDKFSGRSEEEPRWGRGFTPDRGKRGSQDGHVPVEAAERPGRERSDDGLAPRRERLGNKDRLGSQPYQPRTCIRTFECGGRPSEGGRDGRRGEEEDSAGAAPKKSEEAEPAHERLGNPARPPVE